MFREGLERTTKELAASAPSAVKIKVVAPPDLGAMTLPLRGSVPAARRFNLYMHASLTFFVRQVGCLAMCRMRSLGSYPAPHHEIMVVAAGVHLATVSLVVSWVLCFVVDP